jgi:hypothetical protein
VLPILSAACAATPTPTREELAQALDGYATLAPTDLTHVACRGLDEEPTEFACRWRQRAGMRWQDWQGYFALSRQGWQPLDSPSRRP